MADELLTIPLEELLRRTMDSRLARVWTSLPGRVVKYDNPGARLCTVMPSVKRKSMGQVQERLAIPNCRIIMPGGNGMDLNVPVAVGDTGLIIWACRGIQGWHEKGTEVEPEGRFHDYQDAFFLPGLAHDGNVPPDSSETDWIIRKSDGSVEVRIRPDGEVRIKGTAVRLADPATTQALALATLADARLAAVVAWATSHTHPVPGVMPGPGATVSSVAIPVLGPQASVAATKVYGV